MDAVRKADFAFVSGNGSSIRHRADERCDDLAAADGGAGLIGVRSVISHK